MNCCRWQSGWWVGKLTLKLIRGKHLIKKHNKLTMLPFFRARADYKKFKLLKILYILPTEERKRNKKKR
jgi:hypothetical protein